MRLWCDLTRVTAGQYSIEPMRPGQRFVSKTRSRRASGRRNVVFARAALPGLLSFLTLAPGAPARTGDTTRAVPAAAPADSIPAGAGVVVLDTTLGPLVLRLFEDDAPLTCANFKRLVRAHYYDSTYFHRVMPGFMVQGGDPNTRNANPSDDGMGGPGYTIPAEIHRRHVRGALAAARRAAGVNPRRESSGSQFFIDVADQPGLDADGYTVFGQLISGFDTLDRIEALGARPGPAAAGGGINPGRDATIRTARWMTYAQWKKLPPAPAPAPAPPRQ